MNQTLEKANMAREFWRDLESTEPNFQDSCILLFWEKEETLHSLALNHLSLLKEQHKKSHILILTDDPKIETSAKDSQDCKVKVISTELVENILCFYELYQFTDKLTIVSLTRPYGNKLKQLQQATNCSLEDILIHCIFSKT